MTDWKPMIEAPREGADSKPVAIQLFLPGASFRIVDGRPTDVKDGTCVGAFDKASQHWVDQQTGERVYPSQWKPLS